MFSLFQATDPDLGINGTVRYGILEDNVPFHIDDVEGTLITTEELPNITNYVMTAIARDRRNELTGYNEVYATCYVRGFLNFSYLR